MTTAREGRELPIGEDQLARLTRDLEAAHRETLPAMRAGAVDLAEEIRTTGREAGPVTAEAGLGRRRFLLGAGGAAAGLALAACSSDRTSASSTKAAGVPATASPSASSQYSGDLKVVALAVALENQAVGVYLATLAAAKAGRLGTVPPAITTFVTTAMAQHVDHAKAWNAVLTGAGVPPIRNVPLSNQAATTAELAKAKTYTDVAKLALRLEDQAAQTYLFATYNVKSTAGIETAATIAPVEAMHAAILHFVLGQYPVPDDFLPTDKAADPALLTV